MTTKDKFELFYARAILNNPVIPPVEDIKALFAELSRDEFISIIKKTLEKNDDDSFKLFLYYIILFRDMKHIQEYINSKEFSNELLENLVMFTYGHCSLSGYTTERILDEILYFLSNDRLLDLAISSKYISRDKLLLFYILTKLDTDSLNRYFSRCKNIPEFMNFFSRLPDDIMKSIIARNYHMFQYIMLLMTEDDTSREYIKNFFTKYKTEIEQFSRLNDIIKDYKKKANLEAERDLPFKDRNKNRIAFLVKKIREIPDTGKAVEYFEGEKMFADENEKLIVNAIVNSPVLKDSFNYYDSIFIS